MIVVRFTYQAQKGCSFKLAEALKSWPEYGPPKPPHGGRIYSANPLGPWGMVIWEIDFESLTEYDAWLKEFVAAPRFGEWNDLVKDFRVRGGGGEVWKMEKFE